ncbi:unnamed protein product [Acanthoscelides obtectus]|uniref:Uncharacterized protein n=1 Tax=Acanthoscelides obtectus TaxID=200917 RepID=A0A9P0KMM7_ACAOB|nr:unnamed protein product [Acanthoscelides obtectus]CAK1636041.1 hypothetical protein AOBTE_LOCUS9703 [Acanthoscelides obtectus]
MNKDLMRVLLLTSDPFISSKRKVSSKKYKKCNEAVQNYLKKQENDDLGIDLEWTPINSGNIITADSRGPAFAIVWLASRKSVPPQPDIQIVHIYGAIRSIEP